MRWDLIILVNTMIISLAMGMWLNHCAKKKKSWFDGPDKEEIDLSGFLDFKEKI